MSGLAPVQGLVRRDALALLALAIINISLGAFKLAAYLIGSLIVSESIIIFLYNLWVRSWRINDRILKSDTLSDRRDATWRMLLPI